MDYLLLDKFNTNFAPMIDQEHKLIDSSFDILNMHPAIKNLIIGSENPSFFFDATLWTLDHGLFTQFPIVALVAQNTSPMNSFLKSCPFFHIFEGLYSDSHVTKTQQEKELNRLWSNLNQPWQNISAQFAKMYSQSQEPWTLGLNSWIYRQNHEGYFRSLTAYLSDNYASNPWAQFFDLYYRDSSNVFKNYCDLQSSSLGPYAQLVILNKWLQNTGLVEVPHDALNQIIINLFQFKPHDHTMQQPLLSHLFNQDAYNNIFVYQNFSLLYSGFIKPDYKSPEWLTHQLGKAFIEQSFTSCEKLFQEFFTEGVTLTPLQADMIKYFQQNYGAFGGLESVAQYYGSSANKKQA